MSKKEELIEASILECIKCGHDYTHQKECKTYWRQEEGGRADETITGKNFISQRKNFKSAPYRRDSVLVSCECEECGYSTEICIFNNKGQTNIMILGFEKGGEE